MSEIAALAGHILGDLKALTAAGERLRQERRGIGVRLRSLLNMTDPCEGEIRLARLVILTAIGRTEISYQIRCGGG